VKTKKTDYVKIRGIIAIIIFMSVAIFSRVDRVDNYDESIQPYIIGTAVIAIFSSLYFGMKYLLRFYKMKDGTYYK